MIKCPKCYTQNKEGLQQCINCLAPLPQPPKKQGRPVTQQETKAATKVMKKFAKELSALEKQLAKKKIGGSEFDLQLERLKQSFSHPAIKFQDRIPMLRQFIGGDD